MDVFCRSHLIVGLGGGRVCGSHHLKWARCCVTVTKAVASPCASRRVGLPGRGSKIPFLYKNFQDQTVYSYAHGKSVQ